MSNLKGLAEAFESGALLAENGLPGASGLETRARQALNTRMSAQTGLSPDEIFEVSALDKGLFPKGLELPSKEVETIRVLCARARCELRPARLIRSHRRFFGPVIVFLKRLSWPLIRFHLKDTFETIEAFHSKLIYAHARQVFEIEQMKKNLPILP